jgi:hypothetical protein
LIYLWERKRVFGTCLIETNVVDAHPKLPACLGDDNRVGQPLWVVDLPDEASIKQLFNPFSNKVLPLYGLLSGASIGPVQHRGRSSDGAQSPPWDLRHL